MPPNRVKHEPHALLILACRSRVLFFADTPHRVIHGAGTNRSAAPPYSSCRAARESVRAHEALRRKLNEQRARLAGKTDSVQLKLQQVWPVPPICGSMYDVGSAVFSG